MPERRWLERTATDRRRPALREAIESAEALASQAKRVMATANAQDADELRTMLGELDVGNRATGRAGVRSILQKVEDLVFYLQDA